MTMNQNMAKKGVDPQLILHFMQHPLLLNSAPSQAKPNQAKLGLIWHYLQLSPKCPRNVPEMSQKCNVGFLAHLDQPKSNQTW